MPDQCSLISKRGLDAVIILVVVLAIAGVGILLVRWITVEFDPDQIRVSGPLTVLRHHRDRVQSVISSHAAVRRRSVIVPIIGVFDTIAVAKIVGRVTRRIEIRAGVTE